MMLVRTINRLIRRSGWEVGLVKRSDPLSISRSGCAELPYVENVEVGPVNWSEKVSRLASGGPFEWPNMVALNKAVVSLVGEAKTVGEIGGGTGNFAYEAASDPTRLIVCSELDKEAQDWAAANRARSNVVYVNRHLERADGPFDLVVAIDVIEHVADFRSFMERCVQLAPSALITTPNKDRGSGTVFAGPPDYYQHVREWTAGEFYWVLRSFYESVMLYSMPDQFLPIAVAVKIDTRLTPLIGLCSGPL